MQAGQKWGSIISVDAMASFPGGVSAILGLIPGTDVEIVGPRPAGVRSAGCICGFSAHAGSGWNREADYTVEVVMSQQLHAIAPTGAVSMAARR